TRGSLVFCFEMEPFTVVLHEIGGVEIVPEVSLLFVGLEFRYCDVAHLPVSTPLAISHLTGGYRPVSGSADLLQNYEQVTSISGLSIKSITIVPFGARYMPRVVANLLNFIRFYIVTRDVFDSIIIPL